MRIDGRSVSERHVVRFELPRAGGEGLVLSLRPLPLGFHRRLAERGIVRPQAPTRVARDSGGKPIRDAQGLAVLMADEQDADYQRELELYHQRVAVLCVVESLRDDSRIEFESRPLGPRDWRGHADALYEELEEAGWSAGDLIQVCRAVCRLSNLTDEHLAEAQRDFFSEGTTAAVS